MKKRNLLFTLCALCAASSVSAQSETVTFDFTKPLNVTNFTYSPKTLAEQKASKYLNEKNNAEKDCFYKSSNNYVLIISGETVTYDGVSFCMTNPDIYKDYPRYFFGPITSANKNSENPEDWYSDMRWYQTEEILISVADDKKIDKIEFNAEADGLTTRACGDTPVVTEGGSQTINDSKTLNTWTANAGTALSSVKFKASASAPTQMAYTLKVTVSPKDGSAVEEIVTENSAPVYYNLSGARCDGTPAPGIYIRKTGSKVEKVVVK